MSAHVRERLRLSAHVRLHTVECPLYILQLSASKKYYFFGYMTIGQRVNWAVRQLGREQLGRGQLGSEEQSFKIMQLVL